MSQTICKPTRGEMVNALHRSDGLDELNKQTRKAKKWPNALEGACGAEGLNNDLLYSNPACDERAANG